MITDQGLADQGLVTDITRVLWTSLVALLSSPQRPSRLVASDPGTGDWPMWGGTPIATWCRT